MQQKATLSLYELDAGALKVIDNGSQIIITAIDLKHHLSCDSIIKTCFECPEKRILDGGISKIGIQVSAMSNFTSAL